MAQAVGVRPDTIRFYERAGALRRPDRGKNRYREYGEADARRLRLLVDLRRLDLPLDQAAKLAEGCASGHAATLGEGFRDLIAQRRADVARQIDRLRDLDARLAELDTHLATVEERGSYRLGGPCCEAVHEAVQGQG